MTANRPTAPPASTSKERTVPLEEALALYAALMWWQAAHAHLPKTLH